MNIFTLINPEMTYQELRNALYRQTEVYEHAFVLDSCDMPPAAGLETFQILGAFGVRSVMKCDHWKDALYKMSTAMQQGKWYFGVWSYDLKNDIEQLKSQGIKRLDLPELLLVEPEWVLGLRTDRTLVQWGSVPDLDTSSLEVEDHIGQKLVFNMPDQFALYQQQIESIRSEIKAGNVYEMNYCMQMEASIPEDFNDLSYHLERIKHNPVPFAAYVKADEARLLCSSPERYFSIRDGRICSQPIKGTMPRSENPDIDRRNKQILATNEKFRAENVMIVDLVRNDLAKIAIPGSVAVTERFGVYEYRHVFQLISTICANLRPRVSLLDVLRASFPMGSMTGAPKISAMKLIDHMEPHRRQWYSGSVFYTDPEGNTDANVIIRSIVMNKKQQVACYGVGGAITIDSAAKDEYEEVLMKIKGI